MGKYIIKRLFQLVVTLLVISVITFLMVRLIPGDPLTTLYGIEDSDPAFVEAQREKLGLNDPLPVQYFRYIKGIFQGDLGVSLRTHKPIADELLSRYKYTVILAVGGTVVCSILGIFCGVVAAANHNKFWDSAIMVISMLAVSTPTFFLALLLQIVFAVNWNILPYGGTKGWEWAILPIAALGFHAIGNIARTTRSSMLDVINQDYIRTSRAKGIAKWAIITRHALKNALIPILTAIGLRFGVFMAGSALVETVFNISGVGRFLIDGVSNRDYPVVQSTILVLAASFVIINTLIDLLYALVDPRVKYD